MESLLIAINIGLAVILVISVHLQKSEGGALGLGVSQDNFTSTRSIGTFLTKFTSVIATLFIICSLSLTIISRENIVSSTSVIDKTEENMVDEPKIPENNN